MIDATTSPVKYQGNPSLGAWFGDEALKTATVAKMRKHRDMDQVIQGTYQLLHPGAGQYSGCLVGCTLPYIDPEVETAMEDWVFESRHALGGGDDFFGSWHVLAELHYGIPAFVFEILDDAFEDSFKDAAPDFAVEALEAILVGAEYKLTEETRNIYYERGRGALLAYLREPWRV